MRKVYRSWTAAAGTLMAVSCATSPASEELDGFFRPLPSDAALYSDYLSARYSTLAQRPLSAAEFYAEASQLQSSNPYLLERAIVGSLQALDFVRALELASRANPQAVRSAPFARLVLAAGDLAAGRDASARARIELAPLGPLNAAAGWAIAVWAGAPKEPAPQAVSQEDAALVGASAGGWVDRGQTMSLAVSGQETGTLPNQIPKSVARDWLDASRMHLSEASRGVQAPALPVVSPNEGAAASLLVVTEPFSEHAPDLAVVFGVISLHLAPDFAPARLSLAKALAGQKRAEEAAGVLAKIPPDSSYRVMALLQAAQLRADQGALRPALDLLAEAEGNSLSRGQRLEIGDLYRRLDRFEDALRHLSLVAIKDTENGAADWRPLFARADVYRKTGRWAEAECDLLAALAAAPDQPDVLNYLGYGWVERGDNLEAGMRLIQRAAEAAPRSAAIRDSLGWAHLRLGDYAEAVMQLEAAAELAPTSAITADHLGDAYWRLGRRQEAVSEWKRALDFEPDDSLAASLRSKLASGLPHVSEMKQVQADSNVARNETP